MMKKRLFLFAFSLFCTFLYGQKKEDLLSNPNITWLGEGYQNVALEIEMNPYRDFKFGISTLHKYLSENNSPIDNHLVSFVFDAMNGNKKGLYKDENCKIPFGDSPTYFRDTLMGINTETFEKMAQIPVTRFDRDWIAYYRVKQLYYYDAARVKFGAIPIAVAPIMRYELRINNDTVVKFNPICWLKVSNLNKEAKLPNPNIKWAATVLSADSYLFTSESQSKVKVLKAKDKSPQNTFVDVLKSKKNISIYRNETFSDQYTADEIFTESEDEVLTDESKIDYFLPKGSKREFEGLSIVQNWYWNSSKNEFQCYLAGTGMVYTLIDNEGIKDYQRILFFTKN